MPGDRVSPRAPLFHLIHPLGFSLADREVRRAGLDYWEHVDLREWPDWESFEKQLPNFGEPFFFTTRSDRVYWDKSFGDRTVLIFGRETGGLPDSLLGRYADRTCRIPMESEDVRSLNLSTCVGIALYEVLRQRGVTPATPPSSLTPR